MTTADAAQSAVFAAGVVCAAVWLRRRAAGRDPLGPPPAGELPRTGVALLVGVPAWWIVPVAVVTVCARAGVSQAGLGIASAVVHAAIGAAILPLIRRSAPEPTVAGGRALLVGIGAGLVTFAAAQSVGLAGTWLAKAAGHALPDERIVMIGRTAAGVERIGFFATAVMCAPFGEEVFWRAAVLSFLARPLPPAHANAALALVFGMLHANPADPRTWLSAAAIGTVGWILGWLWLRTRSLPAIVLAHATFNLPTALILATGAPTS